MNTIIILSRTLVLLSLAATAAVANAGAPNSAAVESVRANMPVVVLNRLVYETGHTVSATVSFGQSSDIQTHGRLILCAPDTGDIEILTLSATGTPLVHKTTTDIQLEIAPDTSGATMFDGTLRVTKGKLFSALYSYPLSDRIIPDDQTGLKKGAQFFSSDYGIGYDAAFPEAQVQVTPGVALTPDEQSSPGGVKVGTLGAEGEPGVLQIASGELIFHPRTAAQRQEFETRTGGSKLRSDNQFSVNRPNVWDLYRLNGDPDKIKYLPQMWALCGGRGRMHASNPEVLALMASALELWLEGYNVAVNPRMVPHSPLRAPEGRGFVQPPDEPIPVPDPLDSMTSPLMPHWDDPRLGLRDLWALTAMSDADQRPVNIAFVDSSFAPNPDFLSNLPAGADLVEFNFETGERGPHVAEHPEGATASAFRGPTFHGNGTVTVACGAFGDGFGATGVAGQMGRPMLYFMGALNFAFQTGQAFTTAVEDGADVINISAGYPCRILSVVGPLRICSEAERAEVVGTVSALVATSAAVICVVAPLIPFADLVCASVAGSASVSITAFFHSLFLSSAIGDPRDMMEEAVAFARSRGVPIVASAGNRFNFDRLGEFQRLFDINNTSTDDWEVVPAIIPDVIAVGACTPADPYANIEFHGPAVDVWAPDFQIFMAPEDATADPASVPPHSK